MHDVLPFRSPEARHLYKRAIKARARERSRMVHPPPRPGETSGLILIVLFVLVLSNIGLWAMLLLT